MEKCRICLVEKILMCCIFDTDEDNLLSYSDMLFSVAQLKVTLNDGITDKICSFCCDKLKEHYNFKSLIERSDKLLRQSNGINIKRLYFNNIKDIFNDVEVNIPTSIKEESKVDFKIDGNFFYKDTIIRKIRNENGPVPVLEFLESIEDTLSDNDYEMGCQRDASSTDDDMPLICRKRKKKNPKHKKGSKLKQNRTTNNYLHTTEVLIKPIILTDIKVVPTHKVKSENKAKKYPARRDMCPYCGRLTSALKNHMKIHTGEREFKCEKCGKGFCTKDTLKTHMKTHNENKCFKCDKCIAAFNNKALLKSHRLSHSNEKNYTCKICNKSFKRRGALLRHEASHNSANKCIKCEQCKMSFFTKYGLRHHMRVHTGERPYKCEICSQPYSYKHDFNRHCLKKHGVFLKRRRLYVMNEQVLQQERVLMRQLMLRAHGVLGAEDESFNPFEGEGPQSALAFETAMKAMKENNIPINYQI